MTYRRTLKDESRGAQQRGQDFRADHDARDEGRPGGGEDLIETAYGSADFHDGVRAVLKKRKPRWTGR